jgi:hypothetical protein
VRLWAELQSLQVRMVMLPLSRILRQTHTQRSLVGMLELPDSLDHLSSLLSRHPIDRLRRWSVSQCLMRFPRSLSGIVPTIRLLQLSACPQCILSRTPLKYPSLLSNFWPKVISILCNVRDIAIYNRD